MVWGLDRVAMPSLTVPMFSNNRADSHMMYCDKPFTRNAMGRGGGYRAYADLAVIPKPNTQGGRADGQRAVDDKAAGVQQRCQTHLGMDGHHKFFHRLLGIGGLACAMGEKFDGGDIGVGVG